MAKLKSIEGLRKALKEALREGDNPSYIQNLQRQLVDMENARRMYDELNVPVDVEYLKRTLMTGQGTNGDREIRLGVCPTAVDVQIAPGNAYHHGATAQSCPHCYNTNNISSLGEIIIDSGPRPVLQCGSCNRVFSDVPSYIKVLVDDAKNKGAKSVGYRLNGSDSNPQMAPMMPIHDNYEVQQTNQKLDEVNQNLSQLSYTIRNLMDQVTFLASQNNKLMEQLANDPLIHVRKSVTEFDLK